MMGTYPRENGRQLDPWKCTPLADKLKRVGAGRSMRMLKPMVI